MNTFITRWARALSVTAAAAIVLTAGAVNASNQPSTTLDPSAAIIAPVDMANAQLGGCPMGAVVPFAGIDISSSRPAVADVPPTSDGTSPDHGVGLGVDQGTDSGAGVVVASNGNGSGDIGADVGSGIGVVVGSGSNPAAAAPDTGATEPDPTTGTGAGATGSGRFQLVDLDALLGSSGLSANAPARDGSVADLGVGHPAADDPSTVALIDVMADGNDPGASTADVGGINADGALVDGALIDGALVDQGTADRQLASTPSAAAIASAVDAGNGANTNGTGLLGDVVVNANNTGAGAGAGQGDIGTFGTAAPLVNTVAPTSAHAGPLG